MSSKKDKKKVYFEKVAQLFNEYHKVMVVNIDNVSSSLMQKARHALRGKAVMLMGKNTLIRRAMAQLKHIHGLPALSAVLHENVGLVFTNGDLNEIRNIISQNKISGPAKPGQVAPIDVLIPKGPTGLDPSQTTFLQALNIATKITKGVIEILNDVKVITKGEKVGSSEATLLQKLKITPFFFEILPINIYEDGQMFPISSLEVTMESLVEAFLEGNRDITAFCLGMNVLAPGAIPYYMKDGFKNMIYFCQATKYAFPLMDKFFSMSTSAPAAAPAKAEKHVEKKEEKKKEEPKKEEKKKEEPKKEEEEQDLGGLFDF